MNAIELHHADGRTAGVYYCSECKRVAPTRELADECCAPYKCTGCGVELPRKDHRTACRECVAEKEREREAARFAAAEKVTEWDGWIYTEEIQGYNDGYYDSVGALLEYIEDNTPDEGEMAELTAEELAEIPRLPEYVWTCGEERFATASLDAIIENIADRGYEDFDTDSILGTEELGAAIEAFNAANTGIVSYSPNYKRALILGHNAGDAPPCSASLNQRQISILEHTVNRAAGGRYCGGSEDMNGLVDMGLMLYIGKPAWCSDPFYAITDKGRAALLFSHNAEVSRGRAIPNPESE
jgi:hypothetical protein